MHLGRGKGPREPSVVLCRAALIRCRNRGFCKDPPRLAGPSLGATVWISHAADNVLLLILRQTRRFAFQPLLVNYPRSSGRAEAHENTILLYSVRSQPWPVSAASRAAMRLPSGSRQQTWEARCRQHSANPTPWPGDRQRGVLSLALLTDKVCCSTWAVCHAPVCHNSAEYPVGAAVLGGRAFHSVFCILYPYSGCTRS